MFKILLLAICASAVSASFETFTGSNYPVMLFPESSKAIEFCVNLQISQVRGQYCQRDSESFPILKMIIESYEFYVAAAIVNSYDEVEAATTQKCHFKSQLINPSAFHVIDNKWTIMYDYTKTDNKHTALLLAKSQPYRSSLYSFVESNKDLNDRTKSLMCTKESHSQHQMNLSTKKTGQIFSSIKSIMQVWSE